MPSTEVHGPEQGSNLKEFHLDPFFCSNILGRYDLTDMIFPDLLQRGAFGATSFQNSDD